MSFHSSFLYTLFHKDKAWGYGDHNDAHNFMRIDYIAQKNRRHYGGEYGFYGEDQWRYGHGIFLNCEKVACKADTCDEDTDVEENENVISIDSGKHRDVDKKIQAYTVQKCGRRGRVGKADQDQKLRYAKEEGMGCNGRGFKGFIFVEYFSH